jgi:phosphate transport system substrate-binding protein
MIAELEPADLNAQGATFVEPIMVKWTEEFSEKTGGKVRINYQGTGSGAGVRALTNREAAFGCSDAPMTKQQLDDAVKSGGATIHVPTVIGAVVPMYNLPGVSETLKFDGPVLARIFTGRITKWNDPQIAQLNPGVALPAIDIQPVYRSDESGTSYIFSDYLSAVDAEFRTTVGASKKPKWPQNVGVAKPQSAGVAGHVTARTNEGAIGYIELTYALDTKAKYGSVRNAAGKDIAADIGSISAAAEASLEQKQTQEPYSLHDLTYNMTNAAGEKSYPIAAMSFAIVYKKQEGAKGKAGVAFLRWITSAQGQEMARHRNFVPLPAALQKKIAAKLDEIELTP